MYKQMDIGALSLNKSRLAVTFCPEHEYFILSLSLWQLSQPTRIPDPVTQRLLGTGSLFINSQHERGSEDESRKAEGP